MTSTRRQPCVLALLVSALVALPAALFATGLQAPPELGTPQTAHDLVAQAAKHELEIIQFNGVYVRYRVHIVNGHGDQYRDVIESKDGTVARLIFKEGRPLMPEEDAAEHERLQSMIDSPSAFAKHVRGDVSGKKLAVDLVSLMPDAMTYTYVPGQPQVVLTGSATAPPQVVLDFLPNPKWHPPNMTSEALTGLRGRIWIDPQSHRMLRLDADIFQGVNFGWGMLAHIYPGGHVVLEQTNVAAAGSSNQRWIFSHFIQHVTVRALMVKTVRENSELSASHFQVVPAVPYPEAIRILLDTPLPTKLQ